jgi:hypothetical protein
VSKPEQTPLTFYAADWVELTKAFLQIMSYTIRHDLAHRCLNRDLRSGSLRAGLIKISPDGNEMVVTPLDPSEWQQRTVRAPLNPEEGVRVEPPYEDGYVYVRAVDLNNDYPLPGTSTMSAAHRSDDVRSPKRRRGQKHQRAADAAGTPTRRRQSLRQKCWKPS